MSGRRLAEEAHRLRPDIKILFTTGYSPDMIAPNGHAGEELLTKPFTATELAAKIARMLT